MEVTIRTAISGDYEAIYELNKSSLGYDFDLEKTAQQLENILKNEDHQLLVAVIGQEVAGYIHASGYDCTYSEPFKNIMALAVDSSRRGQGIGRRLLAAVEEWARLDGSVGVRLVSGYDRTAAHQFYLACGYYNRKDQKNFVKKLKRGIKTGVYQ